MGVSQQLNHTKIHTESDCRGEGGGGAVPVNEETTKVYAPAAHVHDCPDMYVQVKVVNSIIFMSTLQNDADARCALCVCSLELYMMLYCSSGKCFIVIPKYAQKLQLSRIKFLIMNLKLFWRRFLSCAPT